MPTDSHNSLVQGYYSIYFTEEETEAPKGEVSPREYLAEQTL